MVRPELMVEYVHYFSEAALYPHFEEEEKQVLIYLDDKDNFKQRTLLEHKTIREWISALKVSPEQDPEALLKIAGYLDDHIRFEERELFPYLQEKLSAVQLEELGVAINAIHQPFVENFHTEFWNTHVN